MTQPTLWRGADRGRIRQKLFPSLSKANRAAPRLPGSTRQEFPRAQGLTMSTNENLPGALDGVRILDLTTMVAGPVATMMLADQGADVIKVEPPSGDLMRHLSRGHRSMNASFLACNRNKRSLAIDLKTDHGREIAYKLIATADVMVHNFRPGAAERIGLGED